MSRRISDTQDLFFVECRLSALTIFIAQFSLLSSDPVLKSRITQVYWLLTATRMYLQATKKSDLESTFAHALRAGINYRNQIFVGNHQITGEIDYTKCAVLHTSVVSPNPFNIDLPIPIDYSFPKDIQNILTSWILFVSTSLHLHIYECADKSQRNDPSNLCLTLSLQFIISILNICQKTLEGQESSSPYIQDHIQLLGHYLYTQKTFIEIK